MAESRRIEKKAMEVEFIPETCPIPETSICQDNDMHSSQKVKSNKLGITQILETFPLPETQMIETDLFNPGNLDDFPLLPSGLSELEKNERSFELPSQVKIPNFPTNASKFYEGYWIQ